MTRGDKGKIVQNGKSSNWQCFEYHFISCNVFFLERAGELRVISLKKKNKITITKPK